MSFLVQLRRSISQTSTVCGHHLRRSTCAHNVVHQAPCMSTAFGSTQRAKLNNNGNVHKIESCGQFVQRRFAGHSHWQNTRHIKGANDAAKKKVVDQFVRKIKLAIMDGGSNDPKTNSNLARIMEMAKNADVPKATVERVLKKPNEGEAPIHVIEARGPASSFLCIKVQTKSVNRVKQLMQGQLKKFGGQLGETGAARHAFEHKGIVKVELESTISEDDATDVAIEVGAEDVFSAVEDDCDMLEFTCDPRDIHTVRRSLEKMDYNVTFADDKFIPTTTVALNGESLDYIRKFYDKLLTNVEGIVEIFDNIVEEKS